MIAFFYFQLNKPLKCCILQIIKTKIRPNCKPCDICRLGVTNLRQRIFV